MKNPMTDEVPSHAQGAAPPAQPDTDPHDVPAAAERVLAPVTLDAARAVYRHYADRLSARRTSAPRIDDR